jgi:hypothetical protein
VLLTSAVIKAVTGMQKDDTRRNEHQLTSKRDRSTSPDIETPTGIKRFDEPYSSQESDWQWLETPGPGDGRRRRKPGLLAQTILEEDDDS